MAVATGETPLFSWSEWWPYFVGFALVFCVIMAGVLSVWRIGFARRVARRESSAPISRAEFVGARADLRRTMLRRAVWVGAIVAILVPAPLFATMLGLIIFVARVPNPIPYLLISVPGLIGCTAALVVPPVLVVYRVRLAHLRARLRPASDPVESSH